MLASIALIATKGLNYGLDFTGGVSMEVDYDAAGARSADVREALAKGGLRRRAGAEPGRHQGSLDPFAGQGRSRRAR